MLESIYVGLTGLIGYSKDLSVIGNNVANLNTPGFKSSQLLFSDLFYQTQFAGANQGENFLDIGAGLDTGSTRRLFKQGELRQTGGDQDLAVDGNGFFVLRKDGEVAYTRSGQFSFDEEGFLVSQSHDSRVAALANGALHDINISGLRTIAGKSTARIQMIGFLSAGDATTSPHQIANVSVFDAAGIARTLALKFANNNAAAPGSWLVEVRDDKNNVLKAGEVRFSADTTPTAGFNSVSFELAPEGIAKSAVEIFMGDPGSLAGARSASGGTTDLRVDKQDGFAVGSLSKATFDDRGTLVLSYSNGQSRNHEQLALASFASLQDLEPKGGNVFRPRQEQQAELGHAGDAAFGKLAVGQIEISNVDLAQEFSNLIISQRGYQASSQVIGAANEMMQQLFDIKARR
jgi:flagellar hook protein FlgE